MRISDCSSDVCSSDLVADRFGIVEWIPPVPKELLAIAMPLTAARLNFEIGRLKMYPNLLVDDEVVVTEKLEGECLQMTWLGGDRVEGCHADGMIAITTKGLGQQGLVLDRKSTRLNSSH